MTFYKLLPVCFLFCFTGCGDCVQNGDGVIVDINTHQPLELVTVSKYRPNEPLFKDSFKFHSTKDGKFAASYSSGGLFGCPSLKLYIIKEGYITKTVVNPSGDTIFLEKAK